MNLAVCDASMDKQSHATVGGHARTSVVIGAICIIICDFKFTVGIKFFLTKKDDINFEFI